MRQRPSGSESPSLGERFDPSVGQRARAAVRRVRTRARSYAVVRSPLHYEVGDMRRDYGWQRAAFLAAATTGLVALTCRLVLTGLFVAFVSRDVPHVAVFNAALSGLMALAGTVVALTGPAVWRTWRRRLVATARRRRRDQQSLAAATRRSDGRRRWHRAAHRVVRAGRGRVPSRSRQAYRPR